MELDWEDRERHPAHWKLADELDEITEDLKVLELRLDEMARGDLARDRHKRLGVAICDFIGQASRMLCSCANYQVQCLDRLGSGEPDQVGDAEGVLD